MKFVSKLATYCIVTYELETDEPASKIANIYSFCLKITIVLAKFLKIY